MTTSLTTPVRSLTLEAEDPTAAQAFYDAAFGPDPRLRSVPAAGPSDGFRGFVVSLVVAEPAVVDSFVAPALAAGATEIKSARKSFWGYGAVFRAPDGTLWKIASSSKKNTGAPLRTIDDVVLLLGVDDVAATKAFYVERGLTVAKSFGRKYVEFEAAPGAVTLALSGRRFAAKDAGVAPEGSGSHRLRIDGALGAITDPDGFVWHE
ncbi:glyoxalase [Tsukamurella paurometabola]|uniref:Glyoxalase n=1 Tax=Tsukamurella paurometabola TaxID=2061 RepID=A0A3P8KTE5_TSUPA|nr:glyoxalase [Tsukamurella paurometabola]MBS4102717.1 glyoxalase [Tsukamurella paurometabola]UEA82974.1 glyoxalase [Tsukamurella paurometabola]VDR40057.1 Predicted lactoylglutathione lyase [Tsukamurella paurometabola]